MNFLKLTISTQKGILFFIFFTIPYSSFAQQKDSLRKVEPLKATANVNVTNNGISLFPNLSFGKPAVILNVYATQNSHFLSLQPKISNIKIAKDYFLNFNPQLFHLILDDKEGTYFSEMLSLNKKDLPFYVSSIFTYKLKSTIPGSNIVWNVGLNVKL